MKSGRHRNRDLSAPPSAITTRQQEVVEDAVRISDFDWKITGKGRNRKLVGTRKV